MNEKRPTLHPQQAVVQALQSQRNAALDQLADAAARLALANAEIATLKQQILSLSAPDEKDDPKGALGL